jgi:hypothetical protein
VRLDVHFDRSRRAVANTLARFYPTAQFRAAGSDLRHFHLMAANTLDLLGNSDSSETIEVDRPKIRPTNHHQRRQFAQPSRISPFRQIGQHVGPKQKKQLAARVFFVQMREGIDCEVHATPIGFVSAYRKRGIARYGQFQHFDSLPNRSQLAFLLVRRNGRWQKPHRIEPTLLPATLRQKQVSEVNRVKSAAKYAKSHGWSDVNLVLGGHAQLQPVFGIQLQNLDSSATDSCSSKNHRALTLKVLVPHLAPRMKQFRQLPRFRIIPGHIAPFVQIAVYASQCKIVEIIASAMLPRKNVFDVQSGQRRLILMQTAILAAKSCSATNLTSRGSIHAS